MVTLEVGSCFRFQALRRIHSRGLLMFKHTGMSNTRLSWLLVTLVLWLSNVELHAQVETYITGIEADQLALNGIGKLYWKADAMSVPSGRSRVSSAPVDDRPGVRVTGVYPHGSSYSAGTTSSIPGGIWVGESMWLDGAYFFKPHISFYKTSWGGRTECIVPDGNRISRYSHLVGGDHNHFFITDETGEFLDQARLWRLNSSWGLAKAELVADRSTGPMATWFRKIVVVYDQRILTITGSERLSRFDRNTGPTGEVLWVETLLHTNAVGMARHRPDASYVNDRLVWVTLNAARTYFNFYSAPLTNLSGAVFLGADEAAVGSPMQSITVADNRLYYQIGSSLRRRSAVTFNLASEEMASLDYEAKHLVSNDRYVCWLKNGNTIMRLPVGAAAIRRNLAITGMEVIQAVQNPSNQVPLVAAKPTHVRVFSQLLASSAGESSLMVPNPMILHGYRDGVALPGSPLVPDPLLSPPRPVTTNTPLRLDLNAATNEPPWRYPQQGAWFRLPESWISEGTTVLRAELNPARILRETNYADNVRTVHAVFTQKVPIGIKVIPALTHAGFIDRPRSDHRNLFEQAALMLPTSDLRVQYPRTSPMVERDGFLGLDGTSPYEFEPRNDDKDSVIVALFWRKVEGQGGTLAEPGGFDHYLAMIPEEVLTAGYGGYASLGDDISITHAALLIGRRLSFDGLGTRRSSITLAHELGHNYGRGHVGGCGTPSGVDGSYPFPGGTISDETAGHLGFNAYRRKLLPLIGTADIMSYCSDRWISPYNWQKLFNRVGTGYGPVISSRGIATASAGLNTRGLVGGLINLTNGTSSIRPVFDLGATAWGVAVTNAGTPGANYQLRAFSGADLKASYPVSEFYALADNADVPSTHRPWVAALGDMHGIDSIQLVSVQSPGTPLVTLTGGALAPSVTVHKPEAGPVTAENLNIEWSSTDDGGRPLSHVVRISHDGGASWRMLASEFIGTSLSIPVQDVPGGTTCRVEVIASDGILCGRGVSAEFAVANKPPSALILFENAREPIPQPLNQAIFEYGELVRMKAEVDDIEDGWLSGASLQWTVSGPVVAAGTGHRFEPQRLPPGEYYATMTATDSKGASSIAAATVTIRAPYLENAAGQIVIDGVPDDSGFSADRWTKRIVYPDGEGAATLSWARNGDCLAIAASGLLRGKSENQRLVIALDPQGFYGYPGPSPASLKLDVYESGATAIFRGDGNKWVQETNQINVAAAVSGDALTWSAEICIDVGLLPNGFEALQGKLFAAVYDRDVQGDAAVFTDGANPDSPLTWTTSGFGPDPESPVDADGDGMPDQWEAATFGPNGASNGSDPDHDRVSNLQEYVAGTDPLDSNSVFVVKMEEGYRISWEPKPGRTYSIWRATDIQNFSEVAEGIQGFYQQGPVSMTWLDREPPGGPVFYRVHANYYR